MAQQMNFNKRLRHIEKASRELWASYNLPFFFFTPHDPSHSECVIKKIKQIIPAQNKSLMGNSLNTEEWFYINCAAWLHDIGMIPGLFPNDPKASNITEKQYNIIREQHHVRSKNYIAANYHKLGLNHKEALIIGELCRLHRRCVNINSSTRKFGKVRAKLLGAYLRIADAIAIDSSRTNEFKSLYNLFLAHGMPLLSEFHWLRSFWIKEINIDHNNASIIINFNLPNPKKNEDIKYLCKTTEDDIAEEIASCKDVLLKAKISYFTDVKSKFNNTSPDVEKNAKLKQIASKLKMQYTASSSQVADIMMDTILYLAEHGAANNEEAIEMVEKYLEIEIGGIKTDRPCHILVKYVEAIVKKALSSMKLNPEKRLLRITKEIRALQDDRKNNIKKIAYHAKSLLAGYSPILLFGYSSIIIKIFDDIDDEEIKKNTKIYILECRSKNQLNFKNDLVYCDGLRYATHLKNAGFREVYLVPDIISGNLMTAGMVEKIFFGANTVDISGHEIGHTAGHNTIVDSAIKHKIPIYVFADSYKFGRLDKDNAGRRTSDWFTGLPEEKENIKRLGIEYYNPRSDIIPIEYVDEFYTEHGNFSPKKIPKIILDKIAKTEELLSIGREPNEKLTAGLPVKIK
jgi:translation initiation factor 2B subunit (eIF-2B alpha/beta/delta family)